jgi:hypothetical protein
MAGISPKCALKYLELEIHLKIRHFPASHVGLPGVHIQKQCGKSNEDNEDKSNLGWLMLPISGKTWLCLR